MRSNVFKTVLTATKAGMIGAFLLGAGAAFAAAPMADEAITEQLTAAGMTDVTVNHADGKINVSGTYDGKGVVLVYNEETGALESFDGGTPEAGAHAAFMTLGEAPADAPAN